MSIFDIYYADKWPYELVNNFEMQIAYYATKKQKNITTTALVTCEKRERYKYEIMSRQIIFCDCSLRFITGKT